MSTAAKIGMQADYNGRNRLYPQAMITLGLNKIRFAKNTQGDELKAFVEPGPNLTSILQLIQETAAWCSQASADRQHFRSRELNSSLAPKLPLFDHVNSDNWFAHTEEIYKRMVHTINETRRTILTANNVSRTDGKDPLRIGKLLVYEPMETVTCGASEAASRGFYDIEDAPPWDTWFLYNNGTIFSYVPEALITQAEAGIHANPVDCIHWAPWSRLSRLDPN